MSGPLGIHALRSTYVTNLFKTLGACGNICLILTFGWKNVLCSTFLCVVYLLYWKTAKLALMLHVIIVTCYCYCSVKKVFISSIKVLRNKLALCFTLKRLCFILKHLFVKNTNKCFISVTGIKHVNCVLLKNNMCFIKKHF